MRSQADIAKMRATFAHETDRKNQGGPNFATTPNPVFFRGGKMNRDPHTDQIREEAPASTPMGRTVVVEHRHYKDRS
jgi:hypothetical protein